MFKKKTLVCTEARLAIENVIYTENEIIDEVQAKDHIANILKQGWAKYIDEESKEKKETTSKTSSAKKGTSQTTTKESENKSHDLNKDGVFDDKDVSLAAEVMNEAKKNKNK